MVHRRDISLSHSSREKEFCKRFLQICTFGALCTLLKITLRSGGSFCCQFHPTFLSWRSEFAKWSSKVRTWSFELSPQKVTLWAKSDRSSLLVFGASHWAKFCPWDCPWKASVFLLTNELFFDKNSCFLPTDTNDDFRKRVVFE